MRSRLSIVLLFVVLFAFASFPAAQSGGTPAQNLPARRVVLYKAGVGYFEHLANVTGSSELAIQFTSKQLDDVLNSLTALDLDGGRIGGITYDSTAPLEQRLGALGVKLPPGADRSQFYTALRGARMEVTQGGIRFVGRLLGVERQMRIDDRTSQPVDHLTLVADDGRVRTFEMKDSVNVRIVDAALRQDVSQYLSLVGSARTEDVRRVRISTTGTGTRRLLVSYISEVPVWKSTYRLVFSGDDESPLLQGWAIVDNTMADDWINVDLSLVAGAPQSFRQPISQPYYTQRPLVALPRTPFGQPLVHEPTLVQTLIPPLEESVTVSGASPVDNVQSNVRAQAQGLAGRGGAVGGVGPGSGGGTGGGAYRLPSPQAAPVPPPPVAIGQALADLFEYHIQDPITIRRNESALVPILSATVDAERVALWRPNLPDNRPLRALWLTNSTGLTLDAGTFSVIDGGAFTGQGLVEPLKPKERRLISYGTDLGVLVLARNDSVSGRISRLTARDGIITSTQEERSHWMYTLRNANDAGRAVIIEHPIKTGWAVDQNPGQIETTPGLTRFRVPLAPQHDATFEVNERRTTSTRITIADINDARIVDLVQRGAPDAALRRALQPLVAKRAEVTDREQALASVQQQIATIRSDQERIRENMKSLGTTKEERSLHQRYTRTLDTEEDQLAQLDADVKRITAERDDRRAELSRLIAALEFDLDAK
jgi:hypothetical protein